VKRVLSYHMYLVLLSILWCSDGISEGFVADTFVLTTTGHRPVQERSAGDELLVRDACGSLVKEPIHTVRHHKVDHVIQVVLDDEFIEMAEDQLVFMPLQERWISASQILRGQCLLSAAQELRAVTSIAVVEKMATVYTISLAHNHNYLVGRYGIVVHNEAASGTFVLVAAEMVEGGGFITAFCVANPVVGPIVFGACAVSLVSYGLWCMIGGGKKSQQSDNRSGGGNGGAPRDPKDPKTNNHGDFFAQLKARADKKARSLRFGNIYIGIPQQACGGLRI